MANQTLSIKVHVDLPSAGALERDLQNELNKLKGSELTINPKLGHISGLDRIEHAINQVKESVDNIHGRISVVGEEQIQGLLKNIEKIRSLTDRAFDLRMDDSDVNKLAQGYNRLNDSIENTERTQLAHKARQKEMFADTLKDIQEQTNLIGDYEKKAANARDDVLANHYREQIKQLKVSRDELSKTFREQAIAGGLTDDEINSKLGNAHKLSFKAQLQVDDSKVKQANRTLRELESTMNRINGKEVQLMKATGGDKQRLEAEIAAEKKRAASLKSTLGSLGDYNSQIREINDRAITSKNMAVSTHQERQAKKYSGRGGGSRNVYATMDAWDILQQGAYGAAYVVDSINQVDKAITKVTKVVPDGAKAIASFRKNIFKDAASVGKSAPDYANAVEQWATAGYNLKQSRALAKRSVMGSFVGDVDVNDMVNYMSVPLNSFKKQKLKADDIINSMNQVSNKHAVEMTDLGQAYSKASAVLASTGTNFHQLTGMITGAQEATRAGGDIVGRSIKAIAQNFAKMSSGQTRGDRNKAAFFEDKGVKLQKANGEMKSTYQIMDELSKKWKTMSNQEKQNAALYAAGKEHSAQFTGMLDNWDTVKKATAESEAQAGRGKNGSAYQEFSKQQESLDFQLNKLKNTWDSFINGVGNGRKGTAGMVSDLNGLLSVADKLAANQLISGVGRWGVMAGGILLARRAVGRLVEGFRDFLTVNDKGKNIVDKLTGWSKKKGKFVGSLQGFEDAIYGSDVGEQRREDRANKRKAKKENPNWFQSRMQDIRNGYNGVQVDDSQSDKSETKKPKETPKKEAPKTRKEKFKAALGKLSAKSGRSTGDLSNDAESAKKASEAFTKLGRVGRIAGAGMKVLGSTLGFVGLGLDAITLAGFAMNALGIHPIQMLSKALHPAAENAKTFHKEMQGVNEVVQDSNAKLSKNVVFNGSAVTSKKTTDSLAKVLKNAQGNQLSDDEYKDFKKKFNAIAKANGSDVRADVNNAEILAEKLKSLNGDVSTYNLRNARKGSQTIDRLNNKAGKRLAKAVNEDEFLKGNAKYNKLLNQIESDRADANREAYGNTAQIAKNNKKYDAKKEAARRKYVRSNLNDPAFLDWSDSYQAYGDSVRKQYQGLAKTLRGNVFSKNDFRGMSRSELTKMESAQSINLQNAARANKVWNDVNGILAQNNKLGGKQTQLTKAQQDYLSKNVKGLEGISKDTSKWTGAQMSAFQQASDKIQKQLKQAKSTMKDILTSEGMSSAAADKRIAKFDGKGSSFINIMGNQRNGAEILNVDPDFYGTYGRAWQAVMANAQRVNENYANKHNGRNTAFQNAMTGDDGLIDTTMYSRLEGTVQALGKKGNSRARALGLVDKNGDLQYQNTSNVLRGVSGSSDPLSLFSGIADGTLKNSKSGALSYAQMLANYSDGKRTKSLRDAIKNLTRKNGSKKQTYDQLKDMVDKGQLDDDDLNWANGIVKNTSTKPKGGKGGGKGKGGSSKPKRRQSDDSEPTSKPRYKAPKVSSKQRSNIAKNVKDQENLQKKINKAQSQSNKKPTDKGSTKAWKAIRDLLFPKAHADSKPDKTASQRMKTLNKQYGNSKKLSERQLKKAEAGLTKKEQDKLARQLAKDGRLTKSGKSYASKKNKVDVKKAEKEGKDEEKARQKGRDSVSKQAAQHKKNEAKKAVKDAEKQGKQEGKAKNKGSESSGKSKNSGKGKNKVKVTADTKDLKSKLKSAGKNAKVKVKVTADTKSFKSKIKSAGKGTKVKVKVNADTKSMKSKIKSVGKTKVKVKVDANTSSMKSKIKSAVRGVKAKVKVTADVSGVRSKIKSAVSNVKATVKVSVSGNVGKLKAIKSAINGIQSKSVKVKASVNGTSKVKQLRSAINGVHSKSVSVKAKVSGLGEVKALGAAIDALHDKSVSVSVTKHETTIKTTKGKSIAVTPETVLGANPLKSMSVVASDPALAAAIQNGASNMGVDANSMSNGASVTDYSDSTENVSEDYWRYMDKELYTGLPLDEQVNKLENAVTQADEDMDKLISLSKQRIDVDNKQIAYQKQMQGAYQQQITDMINKLHAYGFQSNGNKITNLGHAKDIHGDNASKVDDLLGKYQSAYQNFSEATQKIQELQTDIWQQGKNQEDYRNTKDQKMVEKLQRDLELLTTAIENHRSILERQASSLGDADYVMKNKNSADQINSKSNDMYSLLQEFNKLALTNFVGTKEADNAKNLLESMQSMKETIMEYADAIDELKRSMMDNAIQMAAENMSKAVDNLNDSTSRMENNVDNLKEGLLSGTDFADLESSKLNDLDLTQLSDYQKGVKARVGLEQQLDKVLDNFAKKNVDRTAQVANQELQINYQKYEELVKMAQDFATKQMVGIDPIRVKYETQGSSEDLEIPGLTHDKEYLEVIGKYQTLMNSIRIDHEEKLKRINSEEEKEALNQDMVYKQLALQQQVYESLIELDRQKIADDQKLLQTADLTTEERQKLNDEITEYGNNIEEAQNNIKKAIKGRFDYEKELLDKQFDEYSRISTLMSNMVTIADALHLDGETQANILGKQYEATYQEYRQYLHVLSSLRNELSKYEKGSFEYNQLDAVIKEYQSTLDSKVTQLLDITKDEFGQHLEAVKKAFEKNVNEGMTADQAKFDQDVWYSQSQKELRLEEMRLKIVELEDKTVEKRINALDAQDKLSKAEADYVDKQLDLALAQQKLNNTINQKDVHYLDKDENGKWEWRYTADQQQVDAARQEVNQARQAIEDAKISNRNDYIAKVEEVIDRIKNGTVDPAEAKSQLEQLNNSYKFILKDIPDFDVKKTEDILQAYNDYVKKNNQIMNDYKGSANVANNQGFKEIVEGFGEQFKMVSKDLGEIFGKQLQQVLNLPNGSRNNYGQGKDNSVVIQNLNLELPNVHDVNEFAKALDTLPQVAAQYASQK